MRCDLENYTATTAINYATKIATLFSGAIEVVIAVLHYSYRRKSTIRLTSEIV